jgi:hypothetical protein
MVIQGHWQPQRRIFNVDQGRDGLRRLNWVTFLVAVASGHALAEGAGRAVITRGGGATIAKPLSKAMRGGPDCDVREMPSKGHFLGQGPRKKPSRTEACWRCRPKPAKARTAVRESAQCGPGRRPACKDKAGRVRAQRPKH